MTRKPLLALAMAGALAIASLASAAHATTRIYVSLSRSEVFINGIRDALLREDAADDGVEVTLQQADGDSATQVRQIDEAVKGRYDAIIVLTVDDAAGLHALKAAGAANIPLVFVNTPPPVAEVQGRVSVVACNDIVAGRLQMRLLALAMKGHGTVAIIRGGDSSATTDRVQGINEILAGQPGIRIAGSVNAHWSRDEAKAQVLDWIDKGIHIDAIAANSDEMALGAAEALRERSLTGKVFVGGNDGTLNGLDGIADGDLYVTLRQDTAAMAHSALANARTLAGGGYAQQVQWVPYELVLPSNLKSFRAAP